MKTHSHRSLALSVACLTLLTFAGCKGEKGGELSERSGGPQSPHPAYHDSLSSYGFERRDEFASQFTVMRAEFDAKVAELETKVQQSRLSEESRAAMADLDAARTRFEKLISAIPTATAETWATARDDVNRAWNRMQTSYEQAKKSIDGSSY